MHRRTLVGEAGYIRGTIRIVGVAAAAVFTLPAMGGGAGGRGGQPRDRRPA
jgi:hypothetical protein